MGNSSSRRPGPLPESLSDPDPEWTEYLAWQDREAAAGRDPDAEPEPEPVPVPVPVPEPEFELELESWPPEMDEPWGPGAEVPARFWQGEAADELPPGPLLAGLTEEAVLGLECLSDNELIGVLHATRRQAAREQYKQVLVTAEFGRRRQAAFAAALARGVPAGCAPGGFPGEELAAELAVTRAEAGHLIDDALDLTSRLPMTLAGMAAGEIDAERAGWIAMRTRCLSAADAAYADEVLAAAAPDLRVDLLADRAARLEARLNPEAVAARKERARRCEQRVEARREASGNACLSGREMDTADVIASKAFIDALAARLRRGGLPGSLGALRVLALTDLTQGRDPLDRLKPGPALAVPPTSPAPAPPGGPSPAPPAASRTASPPGRAEQPRGPAARPAGHPGGPAPLPALVNLIIPAGTLLGWSTAPAQAGALGLLDPEDTRAIAQAAARDPRTRWCATLLAPDGTAIAHGCARGPRPGLLDGLQPQPPPGHREPPTPPPPHDLEAQQLIELLHRLGLAFTPIARDSCDHAQAEQHYTPSRKLSHLIRARTATCDAPGCQNPAATADLEHTTPWPDGPTDQCNLAPRCRTHHRAKQAPDWTVEQLAPGLTRWTLPSG